MSAEMQQLANDPNFIVQFAVGDPIPQLVPQSPEAGIRMTGVYFGQPKRYVLKKAHMSREDNRIFDVDTGRLVMVSHHPGKNPYESLDPLGVANTDAMYNVHGGEWESVCNVTSHDNRFPGFKIRPKKISRHGRQYVKLDDATVMNIGKMSKLKTKSMRPHFMVGRTESTDLVYKCVADMMGRTISIVNERDELVAQMTKTNKAMILTAVFGSGSESTIDIAPGVDCSTILALVYGIGQVGKHYVGDAFNSFIKGPAQDVVADSIVDSVVGGGETGTFGAETGTFGAETAGMEEVHGIFQTTAEVTHDAGGFADHFANISDSIAQNTGALEEQANFFAQFFE